MTKLELIEIAKSISLNGTLFIRNAGSKTNLEFIAIAKAKESAVTFSI